MLKFKKVSFDQDYTTYEVLHDDGFTNPGTLTMVGTVTKFQSPGSVWWCAWHAGEHGRFGYGYGAATRKRAVDEMLCSG